MMQENLSDEAEEIREETAADAPELAPETGLVVNWGQETGLVFSQLLNSGFALSKELNLEPVWVARETGLVVWTVQETELVVWVVRVTQQGYEAWAYSPCSSSASPVSRSTR